MATTTLSLQQFHNDIEAAEAAAASGPVIITRDGEPTRVLIDIAEYRKLAPGVELALSEQKPKDTRPMSERMAMPDEDYFEWDPPRLGWSMREVDLD